MACRACGFTNTEAARFCGSCGASLAAPCARCHEPVTPGNRYCSACGEPVAGRPDAAEPPSHAGAGAERRRVSVLFVDVEDFTTLAEKLDPEEVRAIQSRYFEAARSVVATYGGTIEKFIGDAVMAVWGAPSAHEDDPGRAVRAALALVDAVHRLGGVASNRPIAARAAVTTGEAAVTLGAVGQGMVAGDLVNTAARLQGHAPSGGVLVDAATRAMAGGAAEFEPAGAIALKGRAAPLTAFRARAASGATTGMRPGLHTGPFVGRDRELGELVSLFEQVVRTGHSRLVSVTGIAGIGKSRLAWQLREHLDAQPLQVAWHDGRAPAYGDEITFAAVAEMVRRRIRLADAADPELARRQLRAALTEIVRDDAERRWMEPRVSVLLEHDAISAFDRDELFAAWRRFFERVSGTLPAVLVFEDLHWADAGLLDFIEHLATWSRDHPILVVCLARPELLDRRPAWGSTIASFTALHLEGLPDPAMRQLLESRAPDLGGELVRRILDRAGGVPLYAVEVARTLAQLDPTASEPVEVPDSLHGLIAARIDALPAEERHLLLAAGVLGRRFRPEALLAVAAGEREPVRERIEGLVRRELLTVDEELVSPGRGELAFVQDLVREVAYGTLSRTERRNLHLAAARWLEGRPDDEVAESLAGHLLEAHRLAPDHPDAHRLARRAVAALRRAAQNALRLHLPERALGHLEHALRLTDLPEQRAVVLGEAAAAARSAARLSVAEEHLRELVALQRDAGRGRETARARAQLASVLLMQQRNEPAVAELESALRAIRRIDADDSGVELAAQLARARMLVGDDAGGLEWAERAFAAAERRGMAAVATDVLVTRGTARFRLGEEDAGLEDLRRAIDEAEVAGYLATELRARNNLAWLVVGDDPRTSLETAREAVALATAMGVGDLAVQLGEVATAVAIDTGDWEWALATADDLARGPVPEANRINIAGAVAIIRALRGDDRPMAAIDAMEPFPDGTDRQVLAGVSFARAWVAFVTGELEEAGRLAMEAVAGSFGAERVHQWSLAGRAALWQGDADAAAAALEAMAGTGVSGRATEAHRLTLAAGVGALRGEPGAGDTYRAACEAWRELDLPLHLALCQIDRHRLGVAGEPDEAVAILSDLEAGGLLRLIRAASPASAARPARSRRPTAGTGSPTDAAHPSQPAPDRHLPPG